MKKTSLNSLKMLHKLYRRHQTQRGIGLLLLLLVWTLLSAHLIYASVEYLQIGASALNGLFLGLNIGLLYCFYRYWANWADEGFTLPRFFANWDHSHLESANRSSLLVYAEQQAEEVKRLGYSSDLIAADDAWLNEYIHNHVKRDRAGGVWTLLGLTLALAIPLVALWTLQQDRMERAYMRMAQALTIQSVSDRQPSIRVPERINVPRGEPVTLRAQWSGEAQPQSAKAHVTQGAGRWDAFDARVEGQEIVFTLPAIRRETSFYVSVSGALSNLGKVIPMDAPSLAQGSIIVDPPAYTGKPREEIPSWRSVAVPAGSDVIVQGVASSRIRSSTIHWNDTVIVEDFETSSLEIALEALTKSGDLFVEMTGVNGLTGQSPRIRLTAIPDATPTIEVFQPSLISSIPQDMMMRIQGRLRDDYGVERLLIHSRVNDEETTELTELAWRYDPEQASEIGGATEFYIAFEWDISTRDLFPGDELTFHLEAFDNDPFGPKSARTPTYRVKYPTLMDLIGGVDEEERRHIEDMSSVVGEQRDIRERVDEALESISEKIERGAPEVESDEDPMWMEKRELEELKQRQEELISEARKIEEELKRYEESVRDELENEAQQEQGFTPETLEKMSRIQELLSELLDNDSMRLMQQFEQTLEQLSQQMDLQQIQDLQFSMNDFEQQLDRTLSMLENTYQGRQMEALQEMTQELARRQERLERETNQIDRAQQQLSQEQAALDEQRQALEQELQDVQESEDGEISDEERRETEEALRDQLDELAEREAELARQQEELDAQRNQIAARQRRLQDDADHLADRMQEMQDRLDRQNPALAEQFRRMTQPLMDGAPQMQMALAAQRLQSGDNQGAAENQRNAMQQLQQIAEQLQEQMANMNMQNLQQDSRAIVRLMEQGVYLSQNMEGLTESVVGRSQSSLALRKTSAFLREMQRIEQRWNQIAQTNPFLSREVNYLLRRGARDLDEAVTAGQGMVWLGLHEARQSTIALNQAIYRMMQDNQNMQQQMQQSGAEGMQQQMQQMISQQQDLNQMLQQLREMGEEGQEMMERLREMARRQSQIRNEIEQMMREYRHSRQLLNRLQGIYDEMREVERLLGDGESGEEVEERQQRILTRMLEAGTMQEEDDYGRERRADAPGDHDISSPEGQVPTDSRDLAREAVERPPLESIPAQYREALKQHYTRLSEQLIDLGSSGR